MAVIKRLKKMINLLTVSPLRIKDKQIFDTFSILTSTILFVYYILFVIRCNHLFVKKFNLLNRLK